MTSQGPLPPVQNVLNVRFLFGVGATNFGGTRMFWHFTAGTPSGNSLVNMANYFGVQWQQFLGPMTADSVMLNTVEVRDLSSADGEVAIVNPQHPGTRSGTQLPLDDTVLMQYRVKHRYRGGHFHGQWPGGVTTDITGGKQWSATFIGLFSAAFASFITGIQNSAGPLTGLSHYGVSYYSSHTPNSNTGVWEPANVPKQRDVAQPYPIATYNMRPVFGSQNSRLQATPAP